MQHEALKPLQGEQSEVEDITNIEPISYELPEENTVTAMKYDQVIILLPSYKGHLFFFFSSGSLNPCFERHFYLFFTYLMSIFAQGWIGGLIFFFFFIFIFYVCFFQSALGITSCHTIFGTRENNFMV